MSLRTRISLAAAGAVAVIAILLGAIGYFPTRARLVDQVRAQLQERAATLVNSRGDRDGSGQGGLGNGSPGNGSPGNRRPAPGYGSPPNGAPGGGGPDGGGASSPDATRRATSGSPRLSSAARSATSSRCAPAARPSPGMAAPRSFR